METVLVERTLHGSRSLRSSAISRWLNDLRPCKPAQLPPMKRLKQSAGSFMPRMKFAVSELASWCAGRTRGSRAQRDRLNLSADRSALSCHLNRIGRRTTPLSAGETLFYQRGPEQRPTG